VEAEAITIATAPLPISTMIPLTTSTSISVWPVPFKYLFNSPYSMFAMMAERLIVLVFV